MRAVDKSVQTSVKFVLTLRVNPAKQPELYAFLSSRQKYDKQVRHALAEYVKGRGAQLEAQTPRKKASIKHLEF